MNWVMLNKEQLMNLPHVKVDLLQENASCERCGSCEEQYEIFQQRHLNKYIGEGTPAPDQIVAALLDLDKYDAHSFLSACHLNHRRNIKKAQKRGFYCKPFAYKQFVPDIFAVNTSKAERTGRPMSAQYLRNIDELGGAPSEKIFFEKPCCPLHYDYWWGVFRELAGHYQGDVRVDEQLVGYVKLRRNGNYAFFAQILGHGDFMSHGVMHLLHHDIVMWALRHDDGEAEFLSKLIYAGYYQGREGLREWKKRALFEPTLLYTLDLGA